MANSSKNSISSNKNTIDSNSIINNTKSNNDHVDERYGCQPRISEKVTNVFRRRLFHANNVDDLDKLIDWKETFSSFDYDNPWSAYIPLPTTTTTEKAFEQSSNDNASKRGRVVESIINNAWHRRRQGMNLEPLLVTIVTPPTTKQESPDYNDMVESVTAKTQRIDIQTRYLCRLLDDVYRTGIQREIIDQPTVGRCHRQIGRLLTLTPKDSVNDDDDDTLSLLSRSSSGLTIIRGAAQRAGEILRRMELITSPSLLFEQQSMKKAEAKRFMKDSNDFLSYISGMTDICPPPPSTADVRSNEIVTNDDDDDVKRTRQQQSIPSSSYSPSSTMTTGSSYQGLYPDYPHHLLDINFALPTPTRAIYNMVLLTYAKEIGPIHVAQQAEDVIWSMILRANTVMSLLLDKKQTKRKDDNNNDSISDDTLLLPLFPTTENWNCVLKCWSRSTDIDRAFYAYSFLVSWIEWNRHYDESNVNDENSSSLDNIATPDLESFRLVLRSCLVNDEDDDVSKEYSESLRRRAKEMGSGVAVRLWKEMQNFYSNSNVTSTTIKYNSTIYHDITRAICQTAELPSTSTSPSSTTRRALRTLESVYKHCSDDGMLTAEIFDLVKGVMSKSQFARLLHGQGGGDGK
jgi:hypothetical protein